MYSNIQSCRFYINIFSWLHASGLIAGGRLFDSNQFLLNPTNQTNWSGRTAEELVSNIGSGIGQNMTNTIHFADNESATTVKVKPLLHNTNSFIAILGHNFHSASAKFQIQALNTEPNPDEYFAVPLSNIFNINTEGGYPSTFNADGFSIRSFSGGTLVETANSISFRLDSRNSLPYPVTPKVGSVVIGNFFTMPSVDIQQNEGRHMDGITKVRTPGGSDLYEHKYLRSKNWGKLAPWELHDTDNVLTNQTLAKVGRRSWSLSWSAVLGNKLIAPTEELSTEIYDTDDYTSGEDYNSGVWAEDKRYPNNQDFYSQVLNRSFAQHPMIFQPDINDETNFAIVKIAMDSISYQAVGYNTYRCKINLVEVW